MAHGFGELARVSGITVYKLSPFEQRAFATAWSKGVPNMLRRFMSNVFFVAPPFAVGFALYTFCEGLHHEYGRKNPKDFENDK